MNKFRIKLATGLAVLCSTMAAIFRKPDALALANYIPIHPACSDTLLADEAIGRFTIVKSGTDQYHGGVCDAADKPLGFTRDSSASAAEENFAFDYFSLSHKGSEALASGAIALDDDLVPADGGKLRKLPVAAGSYWVCGRARNPLTVDQAAANVPVVFIPCTPHIRVVT
jgi:hypothetical protein